MNEFMLAGWGVTLAGCWVIGEAAWWRYAQIRSTTEAAAYAVVGVGVLLFGVVVLLAAGLLA